jgi:hypothetical protein
MAGQRSRPDDGQQPWRQFGRRHKKHPSLGANPLYALPEALIDRVKAEAPGLWTPADEGFERDLARTTAGGGFFHRRLFPCPLNPPPLPAEDQRRQERIEGLLTQALREEGHTEGQIERRREAERRRAEIVAQQAVAYTAWLVTNEQFLGERDGYRAVWEDRVAAEGRFPALPLSLLGGPADRREGKLFLFYRRWGLDRFLTWDLPVPMAPQLFDVLYADSLGLAGAGLFTFLPWYLLRDERLSLRDLAKQHVTAERPAHLEDWLARGSQGKPKLGYQRLHHTFVLYRYRALGLASRYGERLDGHAEQLDRAFAGYLHLSQDSVKKVRLELARRFA